MFLPEEYQYHAKTKRSGENDADNPVDAWIISPSEDE